MHRSFDILLARVYAPAISQLAGKQEINNLKQLLIRPVFTVLVLCSHRYRTP